MIDRLTLSKLLIIITSLWNYAISFSFGFAFRDIFKNNLSPNMATYYGFLVIAISFFVRPLGAFLLGSYFPKHQKKSLFLNSLTISLSCFFMIIECDIEIIHLKYTHIIFLILSNFCIGCEPSLSIPFFYENSQKNKKNFWGSLLSMAIIFGCALSLLVIISLRFLLGSTYWTKLYILLGVLGLLLSFLRLLLIEEKTRPKLKKKKERLSFKILFSFSLSGSTRMLFFMCFLFLPCYVHAESFISNLTAFYFLVSWGVFTPIFGILADKYKEEKIMYISGALIIFLTPLIIFLRDSFINNFLCLFFILCSAAYTAPYSKIIASIFSKTDRAKLVGISHTVAAALMGGSTPYIMWNISNSDIKILLSLLYVGVIISCPLILLGCFKSRLKRYS